MAFIITMAGMSSRFHNAGYKVPKYALELGEQNLFKASVSSFKRYFQSDKFIFVVRNDLFAAEFVGHAVDELGIESFDIIQLERDTLGQAESLSMALNYYSYDFPIYVFNIDTIRHDFIKPKVADLCDGYLEVFRGSGKNWSYVEPGEGDVVKRTAEKQPISDLCSNGLYYFKSSLNFQNIFSMLDKRKDLVNGEYYIAPIYNELIKKGDDIRFHEIPIALIDFCGTPLEYIELQKKAR